MSIIDHRMLELTEAEYGREKEMLKAAEECNELSAEICRHIAGLDSNVVEELADVAIMIEQMTRFFGEQNVQRVIDKKTARTNARINHEA